MTRFIGWTVAVLGVVLLVIAVSNNAPAQQAVPNVRPVKCVPPSFPYDIVEGQLKNKYKEQQMALLLVDPNNPKSARYEVWGADDNGAWTIIAREENGCTKIAGSGGIHVFRHLLPPGEES